MAERLQRRNEQSRGTADIPDMIARAAASIRERTPQVAPPSTQPPRMFDPALYSAPAPERTQSSTPRPKRAPSPQTEQSPKSPQATTELRKTHQPIITDDVLQELDAIYRPRTPQTPQQQIRPTHVSSPQTVEVFPMPTQHQEVTGVVETSETIRPPIPAPNTKEAAIFEFELKEANNIIKTALQDGYRPQLVRGEFSPEVVNFLVACGQGEYFVDKAHPRVVSIELLAAQATQVAAAPQPPARRQRALLPRRSDPTEKPYTAKFSTENRKMSPKTRKRLIGAAVCALTPFGLFTASYAATAEFVCKPDSLAAKAACGTLALSASLVDVIPLVNTYAGITNIPVEVYQSFFDKEADAEGPR